MGLLDSAATLELSSVVLTSSCLLPTSQEYLLPSSYSPVSWHLVTTEWQRTGFPPVLAQCQLEQGQIQSWVRAMARLQQSWWRSVANSSGFGSKPLHSRESCLKSLVSSCNPEKVIREPKTVCWLLAVWQDFHCTEVTTGNPWLAWEKWKEMGTIKCSFLRTAYTGHIHPLNPKFCIHCKFAPVGPFCSTQHMKIPLGWWRWVSMQKSWDGKYTPLEKVLNSSRTLNSYKEWHTMLHGWTSFAVFTRHLYTALFNLDIYETMMYSLLSTIPFSLPLPQL